MCFCCRFAQILLSNFCLKTFRLIFVILMALLIQMALLNCSRTDFFLIVNEFLSHLSSEKTPVFHDPCRESLSLMAQVTFGSIVRASDAESP